MNTKLRLLFVIMIVALAAPFVVWRSGSAAQDNNTQQPKNDHGPKFRRSKKPVAEHYIVVLNPETPGDEVETVANDLLARHGGTTRFIYKHAIKGFSIQMPEAAAMALSRNPRVQYVEEDSEAKLARTDFLALGWHLDRIDARNGLDGKYYFSNVENGAGVHAYVIDSGIRTQHTEFSKPGGGSRASNDVDFVWWDGQNGQDCLGHGTAVAGVLGGNESGVAEGVRLHGVRVFGCTDWTLVSIILSGVDWVTANHIKPAVVNMSLGAPGWLADGAFDDAIRTSIANGITYVVSAGNDNDDARNYSPSRISEVITVGATDRVPGVDVRADFSNFGPAVDIFAPGHRIHSASNLDSNGDGVFDEVTPAMSGTSFSSPLVAGAAARFLQVVPNAAPAAVKGALLNSATPNLIQDVGAGSPNRLLFSEARHAFLGQNILPFISEGTFGVDTGIDIGPGTWLAMSGGGQIWSGVPLSSNNGPQGWNGEAGFNFPLPGGRPYSLIGLLDGASFYIGTSNQVSHDFSVPRRLFLRTNDDIPGNGNGAFNCKVELWKDLPDARADTMGQSGVWPTMNPGQTSQVLVSMKNTGTTTWSAGTGYKLASYNDTTTWGTNRVTLPHDVPPGTQVSFTFPITAPTAHGTYNFQWRMIQEGVQRFGDMTAATSILVLAPSNQAEFVSQTVTKPMWAFEPYNVSVTMRNTGNTIWTAGALYRLGSYNPYDNMTWGTSRVPLPHDVLPGYTVTFNFVVTAPSKAGTYNFQWRMVQDGVQWFGNPSTNVAIGVKMPCMTC